MKYKVLVIALLLKNNQIAKYGELVDKSALSDSPDKLIEEGFITEATDESKPGSDNDEDEEVSDQEDSDVSKADAAKEKPEAHRASADKAKDKAAELLNKAKGGS